MHGTARDHPLVRVCARAYVSELWEMTGYYVLATVSHKMDASVAAKSSDMVLEISRSGWSRATVR
jgi:hypothetical protein